MSDIFREVDEDLRRDRMEGLFKRYGGMAVGAALLIIAGTAGYKMWQHQQQTRHEEETGALARAVSAAQDPAKGADALANYAKGAPADMAALARLNEAAVLVSQNKRAEAVKIYDALAATAGVAQPFRDLAVLLSAQNQLDSGDPAVLQAALVPLTADASPWRFSAREATALLAVRAGDRARAHTLFQQLADDASAPAGVRSRARDLAAFYGKS
ncbi:hypothetical protein M2352_004550 [Azospirillum fermentarium]|uniref:hypothetical protein n=1 Tax=Azospirillum fermentarium TaxID=1233114 RepID=UPI002226FFFC|nr:hypothetical protein [Azospirillum fermentarium]MCW2248890.1 hypothetical protein [Azospirillum fermentarium]